ncbi:MAG: hypothetical protein ACRBBP_06570 [Bdellovibrionales bacterium]
MNTVKTFKNTLKALVITSLFGCGGSPSISVLPSTDSFQQEGNEITAKMDILWVIDNSGSMNNFQQAVEDNLLSFMSNFSNKGYDFQIAVTVSDGWQDMSFTNYAANGGPSFSTSNKSRFKPSLDGTRVLSSAEDSAVLLQKFGEIVAGVGTGGSGDERVLQSTQAARLNPLNIADGFFRDDAHLAVILVSDEEDTSWSGASYITTAAGCSATDSGNLYSSGYMAADCAAEVEPIVYFKDFLEENSSESFGVTVHNMAVIDDGILILDNNGDTINDCRTVVLPGEPSSYARYFGERTSALATATGGTISSLCSDFADSLDKIAKVIIEKTVEFSLTDTPANPNLLQVSVKNPGETEFTVTPQDVDNGWTYNATANSIVFHGSAIPGQGAEISILYDPDSL